MKKRTRREKRMYEEKNEKKIEKRQIQFYDILIQCSGKILKCFYSEIMSTDRSLSGAK